MKNTKLAKKQKIRKYDIKNLRKKALLSIINLLILQGIKEKPISSQEIMSKIQDRFDIKIGLGAMYSSLSSLKKYDLVNTKIYKKRRLHFLTNKGKFASKAFLSDYINMQKKIEFF